MEELAMDSFNLKIYRAEVETQTEFTSEELEQLEGEL